MCSDTGRCVSTAQPITELSAIVLSAQTRARLRTIVLVTIVGMIIGPLYAYALKGDFAPFRVYKGAMMGGLICSLSSTLEFFVFPRLLPRLRFSVLLVARTIFYVLLASLSILLVSSTYESIHQSIPWVEYVRGDEFLTYVEHDFVGILVFAVIVSFTLNFVWQINRLLGQGVLWNYITGRYFHARTEDRVFMFLDLNDSTTIAERLGPERFSALLNDFFFDMTGAILECRGEIYQYVGDEIVISWPLDRAFRESNAVRCFFLIEEAIASEGGRYTQRYWFIPAFKAGIHRGPVVISEIGDIRREIVFHGDTMNTTARILSQCHPLKARLLISEGVASELPGNADFATTRIGEIALKGKEIAVVVYTVKSRK